MTAALSWHYRYLHESSHWARYHGSSVGVLLTLLRRTRDSLATYLLSQLSPAEQAAAAAARAGGEPLLSLQGGALAGTDLDSLSQDWIDLLSTYQMLIDPGPSVVEMMTREGMARALTVTWQQSAGEGMFPGTVPDVIVTGRGTCVQVDGALLTTRLLFECAAVLDELYPQALGALRPFTDPSLMRMLGHTLSGEYGIPYRLAERLAGRYIGPDVVHALIDFALNPVVPGLHPGGAVIKWAELDPPTRFLHAARTLSRRPVELESVPATAATVASCHEQWEAETGLRIGRVGTDLTDLSTLREAVRRPAHPIEALPNATLVYAARLHQERAETLHTISHFGLNFVGEGALRFVNPDSFGHEGNWWLFPPLRVIEDDYCWPSEQMDQDDATNLLVGAAVSAALDDVLYGVGPLHIEHLPLAVLRSPGELAGLNDILRSVIRMNIGWDRPQ
ncbi:hypothetical protein [Micromonospora echinofusca]|uniref:hypothetical protein n=1 Tax=Micromonospora echinofusca TaxID=47858 RepID=UPI0033E14079